MVIAVLAFFKIYFHVDYLQEEGTLYLSGLQSNVEVITDSWGIPHIYAESDNDLFFSLGYIHASQRLFQMDKVVRAGLGRLSEVFGPKLVKTDIFLRTIGLHRIADQIYNQMSENEKFILQSYVDGVNTYIEQNRHNLPVEFRIGRYKPLRWEPVYCLTFQRLMGWTLTQSWNAEIVFYKILDVFGIDKTKELLPVYLDRWPTAIPDYLTGMSNQLLDFRREGIALRNFLGMEASHIGSNNWAISGERTSSGAPLLCNDPHLGFEQPAVWFEAHIVSPERDVVGVTFAGIPGVVIGHNRQIAWGLTNMMLDDLDFYMETISPEHPGEYFYDGEWLRMSKHSETIRIKGEPDTTIVVYGTHHGPVVTGIHSLLKNDEQVFTMRWSGQDVTNEFAAFQSINTARDWGDFSNAAGYFKVPGQNVAYADIEGNIGLIPMGNVPIREGGDHLLPLSGESSEFDWQGYVPYTEMPYSFNPERGFVASANVKLTCDFPYYISNHYEPPSRLQRIVEILSEDKEFYTDDMMKLQFDDFSHHAKDILPVILSALKDIESFDPVENRAFKALSNWDYRGNIESSACTIFNVLFIEMIKAIYEDEMDLAGENVFRDFLTYANFSVRNSAALLENVESTWFDDIRTNDRVERREEILYRAFKNTVKSLSTRYSSNFSEWEWGKIHTLTHKHSMGEKKILDFLFDFNVGPFPSPGSGTTVNSGEYLLYNPFDQIAGPSVRYIFSLDNLEMCYSILPTGQSGMPGHKHYKDQADLYNSGKYKVVSTNRFEMMREGAKVLSLFPEKED